MALLFSLGFDHQFLYVDMSQNQNQNQVQLNKKEGDDKKKAKSYVAWHGFECDGSVKKKDSKVPMYNQSRLRKSGRTCYFGPQPKAGAPGKYYSQAFTRKYYCSIQKIKFLLAWFK